MNRKGKLASAVTGALVIATPAVTQPAHAQSEADEGTIEEVIVTARQRDEALFDVPLAVSVTDKATLERDQIIDLYDLTRTSPALEVNQTFGGEQNGGGRIRGIGTGVFNRSVSPSVAYQVDQAPQGNLSFRQLFDMQQVEVLRGPQGTLFGQGASAGVINITTTKPVLNEFNADFTIDYAGEGTLGSESGREIIDAGINIPLGETAAVRISGQRRDEEGVQFNTFQNDFNRQDITGVRAQLLWELSPNVSVNTKLETTDQSINGRDFFGFNSNLPPTGPAGGGTQANLEQCGITLDDLEDWASLTCQDAYIQDDSTFTFNNVIDWSVGDMVISSVTSFRTLDVDIVATNFSAQAFGIAARDENLKEESEQFTQEIRASLNVGELDLIVGAFYASYDFELSPLIDGEFGNPVQGQRIGFSLCTSDGVTPFGPPIPCIPGNFPTFVKTTTDNTTLAFFADGTYPLNDQWDVFGGLRISDYDNDSFVAVGNQPTVSAVAGGGSLNTGESNVSGRIGLRYRPSDDVTLFGSIATGYKPSAVAVNELPDDPDTPEQENVSVLTEEESLALEFGIRRDLGQTTLEANVFYTTLENFQGQTNEFIGTEALVSVPRNIGDIDSYGFEVAAYGAVGDFLTYSAGYIYNNATYPDGFQGDVEGFRPGDITADLGGEQVQYAPEHKLTLTGEYSRMIAGNIEAFFNTNIVYKSDVLLGNITPEFSTAEAHTAIGASLGVRSPDQRWAASLWGRNLTAERIPVGQLGQPFPDGAVRSWPVAGITTRLVGLKLDFNF